MGECATAQRTTKVRNVIKMLANLKLNLGEDYSLRNSVDDKMTASGVEQLFDVENDDDVRDTVVADTSTKRRRSRLKLLCKRLRRMKWRLMK